jgi:histidine decarboxylase
MTTTHEAMSLEDVVNGAIGPFADFCDGSANPGSTGLGHISVVKLSTGMVAEHLDAAVEGIASDDRAERNDAYAGQLNMLNACSFSGVDGAIWGYDIARHDGLTDGSIRPIGTRKRHDGADVPIFPVTPLLQAGEQLFGSESSLRYPLLPGSRVPCARKKLTAIGPTSVWSAVAVAVAQDRGRDSSLFVTDVGQGIQGASHQEHATALSVRLENIIESVMLSGADQYVKYREIFVGFKTQRIPQGYIGCALSCVPFVVLAKNAAPQPADLLLGMSLSEWDDQQGSWAPDPKWSLTG